MPGLGFANTSPSVPRENSTNDVLRRCPGRSTEAWENQEPEPPERYIAFMEQWQREHGWMREGQDPYDPNAGVYQGPHEGANVLTGDELRDRAQGVPGAAGAAGAPGASTLSWTSAEPPIDAADKKRNSNRQQAPIDWEAGAGQERTAVMSILGGRKR